MINGKSISVIVTTYIRYANLDNIIRSWLSQPIDELWVLDGGGKFKSTATDPRLTVFNMPIDLGPKMDYAFGLLTKGDILILADDDVIVKDSFTHDLLTWQSKLGGIVGVIGRSFHGPRYYKDTKFYSSRHISAPVKVGFVGVVILSPREHLGFDVRGLPRNCDDLWWQLKMRPKLDKWVVPTTAYMDTADCRGATAMCSTKGLRQERADFYHKYYLESVIPSTPTLETPSISKATPAMSRVKSRVAMLRARRSRRS